MKARWLVLVPLLVSLAACATAPPAPVTTHRQMEYVADFDDVWEAVIDIFADNAIPIDNMEKDSGLITTDWGGVSKEDMACGSAGIGNDRNRRGRFSVYVRSVGDEGVITVQVNTKFMASRYFGGDFVGDVDCSSKGTVEKGFHDGLRMRLRSS